MCQRFYHAEEEYRRWLDEHVNGYVFDDCPGQRVLHRASCRFLRRMADWGRRTVHPKLCCTSKECILARLAADYGQADKDWRYCGQNTAVGCW